MSDLNNRIEQFKQMTSADPRNELGHFSLGRAYLDAGMYPQAATSLEKALGLNPNLGRAYHLLAQAKLKLNDQASAIKILTDGVKVAAARGEILARNEMTNLLQELGAPVPATATTPANTPVGEGQILCKRCALAGPKLPKPPFKNQQGQLIFDNICANCWKEWIGMGTKVINEMRLPMNEPEAQRVYDKHMLEFLNLPTEKQ